MNSETRIIDPKDLFSRNRLDLIVKRRLFLHWITGGDQSAKGLYFWHIERRAGAQLNTDIYMQNSRTLFDSMNAGGFDPNHPIPVNRNWSLLGGAHRTALASVLGLQATVEIHDTDHKWPDWGEEWFKDNGLGDYLPGILNDYEKFMEI